jgi:hypothetical protein
VPLLVSEQVLDAGSSDCSTQAGRAPADSKAHASHAGGSAGTQQGSEAGRVDERETVRVDDDHLRPRFQGVDNGRHEPFHPGQIERALNDNGGIGALVARLCIQNCHLASIR